MFEVTMRMIVRDHEMRAFKSIKYVEPREIYDPQDLIEHQKELVKGIEVQIPEKYTQYLSAQPAKTGSNQG